MTIFTERDFRDKTQAISVVKGYIITEIILHNLGTGRNMVKLTVKKIDADIHWAVLNNEDAREIGLKSGGRINIRDEKSGKTATVFIQISDNYIGKGNIGLGWALTAEFNAADGKELTVRGADSPISLEYIRKKMDNGKLTENELNTIIHDITNDVLSPGETTAFITAVYINGLDNDEVEYLTRSMVKSGEQLKFNTHPIVDKHSIGGVPGNKITLLVVPIIAAAGLKIPKTSSRAITGAGGTADLMEALAPVEFGAEDIERMTEKVGGVIVWGGATNIAPADDKIIVHEFPLKIDARGIMIASVMAKKIACGAEILVLDIPVGADAKVKDMDDARKLARQFIEIGERFKIKVECAITFGDTPIGRGIGVNLEVREALIALEGNVELNPFTQKSLTMAGIAFEMAGRVGRGEGYKFAEEILKSGKALAKMKEIIAVQGGNPNVTSKDIKPGKYSFDVKATESGYVVGIKNRALITIARTAGAPADKGAGIYIHKLLGERIEKDEPLYTIYADTEWRLGKALAEARKYKPIAVEGMLLERVNNLN